jgi:preprotein translocase subunit SecD
VKDRVIVSSLLTLTLAVAACGGSGSNPPASTQASGGRQTELVYAAGRLVPGGSLGPAVQRAAVIVRARLSAVGIPARVSTQGDRIAVELPASAATPATERLIGVTARLEFYDWEANLLTPAGRTVASQLALHDPSVIQLSQGVNTGAGGAANAGGLSIDAATKLAAAQPKQVSADNARQGPELFMLGGPNSPACAAAARLHGAAPVPGARCLLAGPAADRADLIAGLPPGVRPSQGEIRVVQQGILVLAAVPASLSSPPDFGDPSGQFFVLHDRVGVPGSAVVNPRAGTNSAGQPDVSFGFAPGGAASFQRVTADIAHRGNLVSGLGQVLNQHFAVALDAQLITVPYVDFKTYPDGIPGNNGADITGGFTPASARDLATQLNLGALPVSLRLVSARPA